MPVRFLTAEQERRYGRFNGVPSQEQLDRYFHLSDTDLVEIGRLRWDHTRLGFALQLSTVRFLGTFLSDPTEVPSLVVATLAQRLGIANPRCIVRYLGRVRRLHMINIRQTYGYREFTHPIAQWRLLRWLYALCWTGTDRPSALFDHATAWLVAQKILLPGASVLERVVARVRNRANSRLWRLLAAGITDEQKRRLEALLVVPEGSRLSPMDRLRSGPTLQSTAELVRTIRRLDEVRELTAALPNTGHLPKSRLLTLARYAGAAKAQAIVRLPEARRVATLLAFIKALEASAQDDVLDLFDILVTRIFTNAVRKGREARLRDLRDLDSAALTLSKVCALVLDDTVAAGVLRKTVFGTVSQDALQAAVARVKSLTRPPDDPYFDELLGQLGRIRRFFPKFVRSVTLGAMPAGQPLLEALRYFCKLEDRSARGESPPLDFVPKSWMHRVMVNGSVDRRAWTLCLVDLLRGALRRREVFANPSLRFADPRIGLLDGEAWEAARPAVCRSLGKSGKASEEIGRLTSRLDEVYRSVASNLPKNASVRIEPKAAGEDLVLTGLDRLEEPASLLSLRSAVASRLPRVELPELLLEVDARTGFVSAFTHASEGDARMTDLGTTLCAVLLGEACNTGLEPLVLSDVPSLRRSRLSWVRQNYLRAETLTLANIQLVTAQSLIGLAQRWGGGDVASADGMRFVVPIRTIHAGPNPKYFGPERGITYYNLVSDQFTGLNAITVPGTLRDSLVLLSVVLEQETDFEILQG